LEEWRHLPGEMRISDIDTKLDLGHPYKGLVWIDHYMDISWIIHRDFMAVIVDGGCPYPERVRHFGINYPYMNISDFSPGQIRFGTGKGSTITVEKLTVSELE